jgi:hypothetical protein
VLGDILADEARSVVGDEANRERCCDRRCASVRIVRWSPSMNPLRSLAMRSLQSEREGGIGSSEISWALVAGTTG